MQDEKRDIVVVVVSARKTVLYYIFPFYDETAYEYTELKCAILITSCT